jgi:hypothetical protein
VRQSHLRPAASHRYLPRANLLQPEFQTRFATQCRRQQRGHRNARLHQVEIHFLKSRCQLAIISVSVGLGEAECYLHAWRRGGQSFECQQHTRRRTKIVGTHVWKVASHQMDDPLNFRLVGDRETRCQSSRSSSLMVHPSEPGIKKAMLEKCINGTATNAIAEVVFACLSAK